MTNITFFPNTIIEKALYELVQMNILFYSLSEDLEHCFTLNPNRSKQPLAEDTMLEELFSPDPDDYLGDFQEIDVSDLSNDNGNDA